MPKATAEPEENKETQEETEATPTPEPDQAPESASTEAPADNDTPATENEEKTQEELDAIMNPDNMVQIGNGVYIDQETYDALINSGIDPSEGPDEETHKKWKSNKNCLMKELLIELLSNKFSTAFLLAWMSA